MEFLINTLERKTADDAVTAVHYSLVLRDDDENVVRDNLVLHLGPTPEDADFIEYDDLDKDTIETWVRNTAGEEFLAEREALLQEKLIELRSPTFATGTPW